METKLPEGTRLAFIGCGVMAESMIAGLLRQKIVAADQIVASHPRADRRDELSSKYGIECFEHNADAVKALPDDGVVLLCVKPQRLGGVFKDLAGVVKSTQLVVSIIAGARIEKISEALSNDLVVRAMPNTPSQIGKGMTAWTCSESVDDAHKLQVRTMLSALGNELHVETENMHPAGIDLVGQCHVPSRGLRHDGRGRRRAHRTGTNRQDQRC